MSTAFSQLLGNNQSKSAGTSLVISPSSKTVTVGKNIFVFFASDDVGSAFSVNDNLGNSYSLVKEKINTGHVKTQIWMAPVTTGGSITSITIAWTTNITAKTATASEFSDLGTQRLVDGVSSSGGSNICTSISTNAYFSGELWIGVHGWETSVSEDPLNNSVAEGGTPSQTGIDKERVGTSGGGAASNICLDWGYCLINANSTVNATSQGVNGLDARDNAGAGVIYNAPSAGGLSNAVKAGMFNVFN